MKIDPRLTPITPVERAAARALGRVHGPKARALDIAAEMNAAFDGGEWSGPADAERAEASYCDSLALVADRFGMDPARLDLVVRDLEFAQLEREFRAAGVAA